MKDYTSLGSADIAARFGAHVATTQGEDATVLYHRTLNEAFEAFTNAIDALLPSGRYKALSVTAIEEAHLWAHKATAERSPLQSETFSSKSPCNHEWRQNGYIKGRQKCDQCGDFRTLRTL